MNVNMRLRVFRIRQLFPLLLIATLVIPIRIFAQPRRSCGTMGHLSDQISSDPSLRMRMRDIEENTRLNAKSAFHRVSGKVTIPVVVHVLHRSPEENISDQQIYSQLQVLNEDFQRLNPDRIHTPSEFLSVATNTGISFQLATADPEGNPTTGINRHKTSQFAFYSHNNGVKYSAMGGVDAWPTDQYLNIWVCNLGMGILGYAQFPGGPAETDGVVIGYKYFGRTGNIVAPFNKGRTTTHEVGHWLNLRHVWGDGPCDVDDFVADTPPADKPNHGCASGHSACGSINMVQNFMDYTDDECMNLFTKGQAERMRVLFAPGGFRRNIMFSKGLKAPVAAEPIAFVPPAQLEVTGLTESIARLSWSEVDRADSYNARFRRVGSDRWSMRNFKNTFVRATGLSNCTDYEFQVESVFAGVGSGFSESRSFRTEGCSVVPVNNESNYFQAPEGLHADNVRNNQATIGWNPVPGASSYQLQYKAAGSRKIVTKVVTSTSTTVYTLEQGIIYLYRVRANFQGKHGPFSRTAFFMPSAFASNLRTATPVNPQLIRTYPEQVIDRVEVEYYVPNPGPVNIAIYDQRGTMVQDYRAFRVREGIPFELNISSLRSGVYELRIEDDQGFEISREIVKR